MKTFIKIVFGLLILFALIQFIPLDRTLKPIDNKLNFVEVNQTPQNITRILKTSCYDCHSNETVYPDYAYIAPISWSVNHHIKEGREHLNFSEWGNYNADLKKDMLENAVKTIQEKEMPLPGYIAYHPKANLSAAERKTLAVYFQQQLEHHASTK
ncbi:heme-binding domain-containing protein [Chryseobacterium sp.]|uniref:heme-binding domain-containing protein n=1 Tax=Chryseobacterium sp. TaxID=1871047 RepID=UPI0011CA6E94|nr:heme-binding domain-containing protein [Chryseobacterium sp.]TXF76140.1 cytochrome C [Chryseobacterium sp.]